MNFAFQWNLSENRSKNILGVKFYPQGQKRFERFKEHASLSDPGVVPDDVIDVIFNINTEEDGDGDDYEENNDAVQKEEEEEEEEEGGGDDGDDDEEEVSNTLERSKNIPVVYSILLIANVILSLSSVIDCWVDLGHRTARNRTESARISKT